MHHYANDEITVILHDAAAATVEALREFPPDYVSDELVAAIFQQACSMCSAKTIAIPQTQALDLSSLRQR